jgi:hypothetical protein
MRESPRHSGADHESSEGPDYGGKGFMDYLPKTGRLERTLKNVRLSSIPKSETVQSIEVTRLPDGSILENNEQIQAQKECKVQALQERYGAIDATQITWVTIKKEQTAPA